MSTPAFHPTYTLVSNEGANLHVWYQGSGPLLILIQGGGGDGARFNAAFPLLSEHFTVTTYDRRGNGKSTVDRARILNPVESARDAVAIIKALGFERASVFGTSSGGLIALQLAASYPQCAEHVVVHECPTLALLTDEPNDKADDAFYIRERYMAYGAEAALEMFRASVAGIPAASFQSSVKANGEGLDDRPRQPHRLDYFFEHELIILSIYTPPFAQIKANGVSVAAVEGEDTKDMFFARVTRPQAEVMSCYHYVWPRGHAIFVTHPEEFAAALIDTIGKMGNAKRKETSRIITERREVII